jgi:hypothetical protein
MAVAMAALLVVGTASAVKITLRAGDIVIKAEGGFRPTKLPKDKNAPITIYGGGSISTVSGGLPPILHTIDIEYDKHGSIETVGLPTCRPGQLEATTVQMARRACGDAIVGRGRGKAIVKFEEQAPIPAESPITIFNGPRKKGNPSVLAHAHITTPVVTTFVVPVVIEKISKGIYGYRTQATIPKIAGGAGVPVSGNLVIGKRWTYKGKRRSYINARCETGRLQARGEFKFKDGTFLSGTLIAPCQVAK